MRSHEYSVVGHSRARVGLYIAGVSGAVASLITLIFSRIASSMAQAGYFDLPELVLWPVTTFTLVLS